MKNATKFLITATVAALTGLGIGYILFDRPSKEPVSTGEEAITEAETTSYTCSMHPQIRQNEPGLCPICEMDLIPVDRNGSEDPLVMQMTEDAVRLAEIQTMVVGQTGMPEKTILLNGKIRADERRITSQVAHIPGRIEQLHVTFTGEVVRKGQKLATLYSPDLITAQQELLEALKVKNTNPQLVEAARRKLRYWKIPQQVIDQMESGEKIQETVTVLAEEDGVVIGRKIAVGDYVNRGEVLFDMVDLNRLWVLLDAYEEDLTHIRPGDEVDFTTPSLPGQTFTTRITYIDPVMDPTTRTAGVRAEMVNRDGLLKPEMFVRGVVYARKKGGQAIQVPRSAVLWTGRRSVVYVRVPDAEIPSYEYREIVLGERAGDFYLVESGLEPGNEVVVNGAFVIDAAAQLNNQQSMMNRLVSVKGAETPDIPDYRDQAPAGFKAGLAGLSGEYILIKDALVATDPEAAAASAGRFVQLLDQIDATDLEGALREYWIRQQNGLKAHSGKIRQSKEVEEQRRQFDFLSRLMIETVQAFGIEGPTLYVQHCPMAFNDRGADWLSYEDQILNPYFGDQMLRCGMVTDSLVNPL